MSWWNPMYWLHLSKGKGPQTLKCSPPPVCLGFPSSLTCLNPDAHFLISSNSLSQSVLVLKHFEKQRIFLTQLPNLWNQGDSEGQRGGGSAFTCLSCSWNRRPHAMRWLPLKAIIQQLWYWMITQTSYWRQLQGYFSYYRIISFWKCAMLDK